MIITKLKLDSFASLSRKELDFAPGLNVVLGPNEAGKSTSFHAIQKALLASTQLNKRQQESEIARFIPLGGDTARVGLFFDHDGESYSVSKSWGGTKAAELRLPDGSLISDDAAVGERMAGLLPARSATMQTVLMTYQSGLEDTLAGLHEDEEAIHTLSDLLRKTVMEPDGVPVEDFRQAVRRQREAFYSNWDEITGGPKSGRGLNNRWMKSVGLILAAYYEKEEAAQRLERALAYETEIDRLNELISGLVTELAELDVFIQANEKVAADARKRETVEAQRGRLVLSAERMQVDNSSWAVLVSDIKNIDGELPDLEERLGQLAHEKELAERADAGRELKERFIRVQRKKEILTDATLELSEARRLTAAELDDIRQAAGALQVATTGLTAGKLAAAFHAGGSMQITVSRDLEAASEYELDANDDMSLEAGGRIRFQHADWSMEITSGDIDFALMQANHSEAKSALAGLLQKHGVTSLEEAIMVSSAYEEAAGKVAAAEKNLQEELGGDEFEVLEASVRELEEAGASRPPAEVAADLVKVENRVNLLRAERTTKQSLLDGYVEEYGGQNELFLRCAREVSAQEEIGRQLEGLTPLPAAVASAEQFIQSFEEAKDRREAARIGMGELEVERAELHGQDESSEELETALGEAAARFETTLRKGEAISRIVTATETILDDSAGDIYDELEKDLEHYVAVITDNRYTEVAMEDSLPRGFERPDGVVLLYDLLSHGTRDVLGLALRLAMASHFLRESDGFLAMDDPMVNLDPERQQKAALILREYADSRQVIVFTCHPSHAELLGGNLIRM